MMVNPFRRSAPKAVVRQLANDMQMRADAARDAGEHLKAAYLFAEVVNLAPDRAGLLLQAGHMFKEAGEFEAAEEQYQLASRKFPQDAELALQLGHFFKTVGRLKEARAAYQRALVLSPGWGEPQRELDQMAAVGMSVSDGDAGMARAGPADEQSVEVASFETEARALHLAAELAPRPVAQGLRNYGRSIEIRQLGRVERSFWGRLQTLRGVEAIQGACISDQPIQTITLMLNKQMVYRGPVRGGYPLPHDEHARSLKYVFNVWIDFTDFLEGSYELEYRATDIENRTISRTEWVVIAPPLAVPNLPDSDSNVPRADPEDPRSLEEQVNARPSMVRPARRALFKQMPKTILVQRPDVLGDLVVSVPALKRLRSLFPDAHFVGVISKANRDLAENLGFFDELVETDLAFNHWEQRRVVTLDNQRALAKQLAHYEFDLAIDLCAAGESRLLLPLAGTPVMVGFRCGELPGLTVEVTGSSNDPWNGHDMVPHTNKALALVEWLGAMMRTEDNIVRRPLDRALIADLEIPDTADYIVLHAGGRWDFSQWPHYPALVDLLLAKTDLTVVLLANDDKLLDRISPEVAASDRFRFLARRLSFDSLDALVSLAAVFVGDDSGVKHLAALRGTKVIGIQNARNNWAEWGHENEGYIMTRKLPCAGCQIQHYPESLDCGRDFICITGIKPEEVLETVQRLIEGER